MSIITLITDFGTKDHFVAKIKGTIISELPQAGIVDISHQISPFNIMEAAYVIENSYQHFPEKTIHIIGVDSENTPECSHIVVKLNDQYFICADNGIMSIVCHNIKPDKIFEINIHNKIDSQNSGFDTSPIKATDFEANCFISSQTSFNFSRFSKHTSINDAPSRAKDRAISRPIPLDAPVITATLCCNIFSFIN